MAAILTRDEAAQLSTRLYLVRKERAVAMVRQRTMPAAKASHALYPWLAVACLCGACLPELAEEITARHEPEILFGKLTPISDGEARWLVADAICPAARWGAVLAKAAEAAPLVGYLRAHFSFEIPTLAVAA